MLTMTLLRLLSRSSYCSMRLRARCACAAGDGSRNAPSLVAATTVKATRVGGPVPTAALGCAHIMSRRYRCGCLHLLVCGPTPRLGTGIRLPTHLWASWAAAVMVTGGAGWRLAYEAFSRQRAVARTLWRSTVNAIVTCVAGTVGAMLAFVFTRCHHCRARRGCVTMCNGDAGLRRQDAGLRQGSS